MQGLLSRQAEQDKSVYIFNTNGYEFPEIA